MASQSRDMLNQSFLQSYLLQSLNMALGALMQGETSYTNSFTRRRLCLRPSPALRLYP